MPLVHDHEVRGVDVDSETRCTHYDTETDVLAIRFLCCDTYYPCYQCHAAIADHEATVWPADTDEAVAILCGRCGVELTIQEYLDCEDTCPTCGGGFNPGCRRHYHHYFASGLLE